MTLAEFVVDVVSQLEAALSSPDGYGETNWAPRQWSPPLKMYY